MQLLFWIVDGLLAGWLTGWICSSDGRRNRVMEIVMGTAGAVAGGFLVTVTPLLVHGKMIYANLAAILGAVTLAILSRHLGASREYGSTLQKTFFMRRTGSKGTAGSNFGNLSPARGGTVKPVFGLVGSRSTDDTDNSQTPIR